MKKNLLLLLMLSILCAYAVLTFQKTEFILPKLPTDAALSKFIDFSNQICLLIAISLFTILVLSPTENREGVQPFSSRVWIMGVFSILGITTASVLIFNPLGAFTWNIDRIADKDSRIVKPYIYSQLNPVPNIIFLGTSISYRIQAQEYAKKLSLRGFNFSVLGGTTVDYYTLTNFILSKSTPHQKPAVIITEVLSPSLSPTHIQVKFYERYPIEYAVYMPLAFSLETISTHIDNIFILSSFSKIFYVEYFTRNKQWPQVIISKSKDEAGKIMPPLKNKAAYKIEVTQIGKNQLDKLLRCDQLNSQGKDAIFKMVTLSKEQNISIVFYRSPINDDFYTFTKKNPKTYKSCEEKFNQFMEQIQTENPNVFYVDLSHYEPISSGGKALYSDSHHLNSVGSERVLEVLTPTIQKAIQYTRSR